MAHAMDSDFVGTDERPSEAGVVATLNEPRDCPDCLSAGSVYGSRCQVCLAELADQPVLPLRFADVIEELRAIALMASDGGLADGHRVAASCRRAELLLERLRRQFMTDVVFGERQTAPVA